jgi:UPF0716 protein FxsA
MARSFKIAALALLAAFPLLEIALLIRVGELIGVWRLALIVIVTAIFGAYVIRQVGLLVFERALLRLESDREGFSPLFDGFLQVVAGIFLIFPGLISDAIGLVLLLPPVRRAVIRTGLLKLVTLFHYQAQTSRGAFHNVRPTTEDDGDGIVIEGEYERVSEKPLAPGKSVQPRHHRQ